MLNKTVKKGLWLSAGIFLLLLAIIGLLLPIIPQLPFFIASIFCFMEFSERFQKWIHEKHWFARIKKHLPHHKKKNSP